MALPHLLHSAKIQTNMPLRSNVFPKIAMQSETVIC